MKNLSSKRRVCKHDRLCM